MSTIYYDSSERLAEILGFAGVRRVQQLVKEKVLIKDPNGKFDIPSNVERFFKYKLAGTADLEQEKALHERTKREIADIQLAKLRGEIHLATDVEMVLTGMLVNFRARVMGMPQKLAPQIVGMETIAEIAGLLEVSVTEALLELTDYNPAMFAEVHDATKDIGPVQEDIEGSGATAEAQGFGMGGQIQKAEPGKRSGTRAMENKPCSVPKGDHGRGKRPANRNSSRTVKQPGGKK